MHPLTFAPRRHYACTSQIRQVPRNLWLWGIDHLGEVADAQFLLGHKVKEPQSCRIGKGPEKLVERRRCVSLFGHNDIIFVLTNMFQERKLMYLLMRI